VNHQQHFVDPATGVNAQELSDQSWTLKLYYWREYEVLVVSCSSLILTIFCWKVMRKNSNDLFVSFLTDVQNAYR